MKKMLLPALVLAVALFVGPWGQEADAALPVLSFSNSFVGCNGNVATYDLLATSSGGSFLWSQGVTPLSGPNDNPNFATASFSKQFKCVWVQVGIERIAAFLSNPCLEPDPDGL